MIKIQTVRFTPIIEQTLVLQPQHECSLTNGLFKDTNLTFDRVAFDEDEKPCTTDDEFSDHSEASDNEENSDDHEQDF